MGGTVLAWYEHPDAFWEVYPRVLPLAYQWGTVDLDFWLAVDRAIAVGGFEWCVRRPHRGSAHAHTSWQNAQGLLDELQSHSALATRCTRSLRGSYRSLLVGCYAAQIAHPVLHYRLALEMHWIDRLPLHHGSRQSDYVRPVHGID